MKIEWKGILPEPKRRNNSGCFEENKLAKLSVNGLQTDIVQHWKQWGKTVKTMVVL